MRSDKFHLWRYRKDTAIRWLIAVGGVGVIFAVVLIFFYLLWVVFPLFLPAGSHLGEARVMQGWGGSNPVYLTVEEQIEVGLRVSDDGTAQFFHVDDGENMLRAQLPLSASERVSAVTEAVELNGLVAVASNSGEVFVFRHLYETSFAGGVDTRLIAPKLEFPYGEEPLLEVDFPAVSGLAYSDGDSELVIAAVGAGGRIRVNISAKNENFMTGELTLEPEIRETDVTFNPTSIAVSGNHRWLYLGDNTGKVYSYSLPGLEPRDIIQAGDGAITSMTMLLGGISVLAGDSQGQVSQLFPVRGEDNRFHLQLIRQFEGAGSPVAKIIPEQRRKGFVILDNTQNISVFHSTSGRHVLRQELRSLQPRSLALSPRSYALLIDVAGGKLQKVTIEYDHP